MTAHLGGERGDRQTGKATFDKLYADMSSTLAAAGASSELQVAFVERWRYIDLSRYGPGAEYGPQTLGAEAAALTAIEDQAQELVDLGPTKLTRDIGTAAAKTFAVQVEYLMSVRKIEGGSAASSPGQPVRAGAAGHERALQALKEQYDRGEISPGPAAQLAGQRLVEFTVSSLGWLAGPPKGNGDAAQPKQ